MVILSNTCVLFWLLEYHVVHIWCNAHEKQWPSTRDMTAIIQNNYFLMLASSCDAGACFNSTAHCNFPEKVIGFLSGIISIFHTVHTSNRTLIFRPVLPAKLVSNMKDHRVLNQHTRVRCRRLNTSVSAGWTRSLCFPPQAGRDAERYGKPSDSRDAGDMAARASLKLHTAAERWHFHSEFFFAHMHVKDAC